MLTDRMRRDAPAWLAAVVAVALLLGPGVARAGTYDVVACGPDGSNHAWTFERYSVFGRALSDPSTFVTDADAERCDAESGVSITSHDETGVKRVVRTGEGGAWVFRAPAGTTVDRLRFWRNAVVRESTDDPGTALAEDGVWTYVARIGGSFPPTDAIAAETCPGNVHNGAGGYCRRGEQPLSGAQPVEYAVDAPVVSVGIECQGDVAKACFTNTGAQGQGNAGLNFERAIVTVDDPVAPAVGVDLPVSGHRRPADPLTASGSDSGGVSSLRVLVDGAERAQERFECDHRLRAPCPVAPEKRFDLGGVADGRHALAVIGTDTAGNVTRIDRTVDVDGTPPAVTSVDVHGRVVSAVVTDALSGVAGGLIETRSGPNGAFTALPTGLRGGRLVATAPSSRAPASAGIRVVVSDRAGNVESGVATSLSLSTRVGKAAARPVRNARAAIAYGHAVRVLGRLTTTDGAPLAGQPIALMLRTRVTGARERSLPVVRTDASGRFSVLVPAGPSRDLRVAYAGAAAGGGLLPRTRSVALRVAASSTIHASSLRLSGGGTIRFSGRLRTLGASIPGGGKIVELQASQHGRWSTVATTRARPSWRAVARFRGTPGRYPIRVRIRREAAFAYELGYSPAVTVHVR